MVQEVLRLNFGGSRRFAAGAAATQLVPNVPTCGDSCRQGTLGRLRRDPSPSVVPTTRAVSRQCRRPICRLGHRVLWSCGICRTGFCHRLPRCRWIGGGLDRRPGVRPCGHRRCCRWGGARRCSHGGTDGDAAARAGAVRPRRRTSGQCKCRHHPDGGEHSGNGDAPQDGPSRRHRTEPGSHSQSDSRGSLCVRGGPHVAETAPHSRLTCRPVTAMTVTARPNDDFTDRRPSVLVHERHRPTPGRLQPRPAMPEKRPDR